MRYYVNSVCLFNDSLSLSLSLSLSQDEKSATFQVRVKDCPVGTILEPTAITGYSQCVCNEGRKEIVFCENGRVYMNVSLSISRT